MFECPFDEFECIFVVGRVCAQFQIDRMSVQTRLSDGFQDFFRATNCADDLRLISIVLSILYDLLSGNLHSIAQLFESDDQSYTIA